MSDIIFQLDEEMELQEQQASYFKDNSTPIDFNFNYTSSVPDLSDTESEYDSQFGSFDSLTASSLPQLIQPINPIDHKNDSETNYQIWLRTSH
jgi:hypothetical protein